MANKSEKQLKSFVKFKKDSLQHFRLRPQGDNLTIEKDAINICEIEIEGVVYSFGGISEGFYDKMNDKYGEEAWRIRMHYKNKNNPPV